MSEENQSSILTDTQQTIETLTKEVVVENDNEHEIDENGLFIIDNGNNRKTVENGKQADSEEELEFDDDEFVINQDNTYEEQVEDEQREEERVNGDDIDKDVHEQVVELEDEEDEDREIAEIESKYEEIDDESEQEVHEVSEDQESQSILEESAYQESFNKEDEEEEEEEEVDIVIVESKEDDPVADASKDSIEDIEMVPQSQQQEPALKSTEHTINEDLDDVITLTEDPEFAQPIEPETELTTTGESTNFQEIPIYLNYFSYKFLLFPYDEDPDTHCIYENEDYLQKSIEEFFASLREDQQLNEVEPFLISEEIILTIPQFENLKMTEDNLYCRDISIGDFVSLFRRLSDSTKNKTKIPKQLTFELTTQPRFITKYNALVDNSQDSTNGGFDHIHIEENDEDGPVSKKRKIE
ncbi:Reduced meiotic recombination protein 1 [Candida tropicalis]